VSCPPVIRNGLVQLAACCWLLGFGVLLTPPVVETFCLDLLLSWVSRNDDRLDMSPVDTSFLVAATPVSAFGLGVRPICMSILLAIACS
jgi:hypothetical protein